MSSLTPRSRQMSAVRSTERGFAVEELLARCQRTLEHRHSLLQRLGKTLLLLPEHLRDALAGFRQFRKRSTHRAIETGDQAIKKRLLLPELVAVPDRAADDPPQHVAAPLVPGNHSVDDQKAAGADMVGDDVERRVRKRLLSGLARSRTNQVLEQIDLVVRVNALQHCRDALEAHSGIDGRLRQRMQHTRIVAVELHEHEIPDLDVAVAVGVGAARRPALDPRAVVVEDLTAGAARAGVRHLPEIVGLVFLAARLVADAHAAFGRHADHLRPQDVRFVVGFVYGGPEPLGRQAVDLGEQLPREVNRVLLEIVAEREVAEHLEERVVARGISHVLQVVVLAARAHAALRSRCAHVRALLPAEERVLELHHPGVHEQQRRVVRGHERARGHDRVGLRAKILEKARADLA